MTEKIKTLLDNVEITIKKYAEIAEITGENFNIFSILKLQSDEVRLHSRLIGELLNPRGSHGQKELFLKLFISTLELNYPNESLKDATVIIEENIGEIPEDYSKGGRVDIVVKIPNSSKEIVIENKIYALDQPNQLGRYYERYPNAHLIYLTPHEKKPSFESLGAYLKVENIKCITYKNEIKVWLEMCLEKIASLPLIRETIIQYINVIKILTNQTMNDKMNEELATMIANNSEYIKGTKAVISAWEAAQFKIIENLIQNINVIATELGLELDIDKEYKLGKKDSSFWIFKAGWCYCIYFFFEEQFEPLIIGIDHIPNKPKCSDEKVKALKKHLASFRSRGENSNWIWLSDIDVWNDTSWEDVKNKVPEAIKNVTIELLNKLETFENPVN